MARSPEALSVRMWRPAVVAMAAWSVIAWSDAADACEPMVYRPPSSEAVLGEGCSASWVPNGSDEIWLEPVKDLGNGFLLQTAGSGQACYSQSYGVLMDCAAGQVLVFGPEVHDLMESLDDTGPTAFQEVSVSIEVAAKAGRPMSLDEAEAASDAAGLSRLFRLEVAGVLGLSGINIPLDCGCRTYYPDLKPGG